MARDSRALISAGAFQTISKCQTGGEEAPGSRWVMPWATIAAAMAIGFIAVLASCATLRTPLAELSFPPQDMLRANRGGVDLGVKPMVGEEDYIKLFDDFLPQVGIVALWIEVGNDGPEAIEIRPSNWRLCAGNRSFHVLKIPQVFDRYYQRRKIRMYSVATDLNARQELQQMSFEHGWIEPGRKRVGLLFFLIDPVLARSWEHGATLDLAGIHTVQGLNITIQIKISHADS